MNSVTVYIATTINPVAIQRITEEDPEVNSVICLAGKAISLPISGAYNAFVRNPTGVIQRDFGHSAYRIDVSGKIEDGYSWQLGVFVAHALKRARRLVPPGHDAETVIIATGEVDRDLNLHPIDGVPEKIKALGEVLPEIIGEAATLVIAVPAGTEGPWRQAFENLGIGSEQPPQVMAVSNADELLERLGLPPTRSTKQPEPGTQRTNMSSTGKKQTKKLMLIAALAIMTITAALGGMAYSPEIREWIASRSTIPEQSPDKNTGTSATPSPAPNSLPDQETTSTPSMQKDSTSSSAVASPKVTPAIAEPNDPQKKPTSQEKLFTHIPIKEDQNTQIKEEQLPAKPVNSINIRIDELRAPPGYRCKSVRDGKIDPVRVSPSSKRPAIIKLVGIKNLCSVEISATTQDTKAYVFGRYMRWVETHPGNGPPNKIIDLGPHRHTVSWTVDIPNYLNRSAFFRVLLFITDKEYSPKKRILARLTRLSPRSEKTRKILNRLQKQGITVAMHRFRVIPKQDLLPPPSINPQDTGLQQ